MRRKSLTGKLQQVPFKTINCTAFIYAQKNIRCECPKCKCPASGGSVYSFRYVDESRNCIYYDVPKAASSTIREKLGIEKLPHRTSLINPSKDLDSYFSFTVVRNPWDRMYSNWKMFTTRKSRIKQLKSMTRQRLSSFSEFIDFAIINPNHHWQEQCLFVPTEISFIGKMEEMSETLRYISINVPDFSPENVKINADRTRSKNTSYQEAYSEETKNKVGEYYRNDILRFKYEF